MKLKTLKDLEVSCSDEDYDWVNSCVPKQFAEINKNDLKQEAINLIKAARKFTFEERINILKNSEPVGDCSLMKIFFNITEEDLK